MALNNPQTIKQAVDQAIDGLGGSSISSIGIEADDWGDFCKQVGADPDAPPAIYRNIAVHPVHIGGGITINLFPWQS